MDLPKSERELCDAYFMKEDLIKLCEKYNLPSNGSKRNLLEYIGNFTENKPVEKIRMKQKINLHLKFLTQDRRRSAQ